MKQFVQRLREPSTWAGLGILAVLFGIDPNKVAAVHQVAAVLAPFVPVDGGVLAQTIIAAAGVAAVALPEKQGAAPAAPAASE